MIFNLEGSCGIMSMNYLTRELKDTPQLKIVRPRGFKWNYRHEQSNLRTSWVTCNNHMIKNKLQRWTSHSTLKGLEL